MIRVETGSTGTAASAGFDASRLIPAWLGGFAKAAYVEGIVGQTSEMGGKAGLGVKLDVVLPHSGGCFPYIAGRVDRGIAVDHFKLQRPFREYIRRFHYDTLTYYPEILRFLITMVGSDRVVIGTDNYALMDVQEPNALVEQLNLPQQDRERIFRGNAEKLFKL